MLEKLLEDSLEDARLQQRFTDAERTPQANPGELTAADMDRLVDFVVDALPQDEQSLQRWVGKYLTTPKASAQLCEAEPVSRAELSRLIRHKKRFEKSLDARLLYFPSSNDIHLFANGNHHQISSQHLQFVEYLCRSAVLLNKDYSRFLSDSSCFDTLQELLTNGIFTVKR